MAVRRRPETIDPPRSRLQTQPINTYVRPEVPAEDLQLAQLAKSLGGFSDTLGAFGRAYTRSTADDSGSGALGLRLRTAIPELSRRLQSGDIPPEVNRTVLEMGHGEDLARSHFEDIRRRYLGESTAPTGQPSNAFDRDSGNIDEWFAGVVQEYEGQLPQLPGVLHGWRRMMQGAQERLYTEHQQYVTQRTVQANLDAAHRSFVGIATEAIAGGERDPQAIHRQMQDAFTQTSRLHRLTPAQARAALFSAARSIAEQGIPGHPMLGLGLVREMLLGPRGSQPPLGSSNEYAHQTNQVIEEAQRTAQRLQRELNLEFVVKLREDALNGRLDEAEAQELRRNNPHLLTQGEWEALFLQNRRALEAAREEQAETAQRLQREAASQASHDELNLFLRGRGDEGTLLTIPERMPVLKPNGEPEQLQRPALIDRAIDNELARIAEWGRQQEAFERDVSMSGSAPAGPSIEQRVFDRTYQFINRNGLTHPAWRDVLNSGYAAATPDALASNNPPPILAQAVQLYEQLEARSPGLLERHLGTSQATRDFYRTYRIMRTLGRQDTRQALISAATATNDIGGDDSRAPAFKKIDEELARGQSWFSGAVNAGDMRDDVRRLSRALVRAGMAPEAAVRAAGDDVRKQYTNINGFMVRTGDRHIEAYGALLRNADLQPRTFQESVQRYLEEYARDNPEAADALRVDPSTFGGAGGEPFNIPRRTLSIRPTTEGTGTWAIIDATTGLPVPSANGMRQVISLRDLLEFEQRTQGEERQREAERLAREARENPPRPAPTFRAGRPNYRLPTADELARGLAPRGPNRGIRIGEGAFEWPEDIAPEE